MSVKEKFSTNNEEGAKERCQVQSSLVSLSLEFRLYNIENKLLKLGHVKHYYPKWIHPGKNWFGN